MIHRPLSVLIVVMDRMELTLKCLEKTWAALKDSEFSFEVRILFNESPENLKKEVLEFQKRAPEIIHTQSVNQRLNPGAARNLLLNERKHSWVFFIDDDAYVKPGFFENFVEALNKYPDAILIGGPNLTPKESSFFQKLNGAVLGSAWGTLVARSRYRGIGDVRRAREVDLTSCGLFLNCEAISENFPEHYRTAEESFLILSLLNKFPDRVIYSPKLSTFHYRRQKVSQFFHQIYNYARGRARLCVEGRSRWGLFWLPTTTLVFGAILLPLYLTVTMIFATLLGFRERSLSLGLASIPVFLLVHVAYALGFASALWNFGVLSHKVLRASTP